MRDVIESLLPEGWTTDADYFGIFDMTLTAPDGCTIEVDGRCAHGHVSPLKALGLI